MATDLKRLIVRHRHVAPMLSALLGATGAALRITDATGAPILERDTTRIAADSRHPILVEGEIIGWVEGDHLARGVAAVLSYASARETDKRSLAQEALDRYRELNLVYDLAERLSADLDASTVVRVAEEEAGRLIRDGRGIFRAGGDGILGAVGHGAVAEIVNDVAADARANAEERRFTSLAAAPVMAHGERLGALAVVSEVSREVTSADLKLLTAVAAIVGPVLDRATSRERGPAVVGSR
jgi:hypothetical protein